MNEREKQHFDFFSMPAFIFLITLLIELVRTGLEWDGSAFLYTGVSLIDFSNDRVVFGQGYFIWHLWSAVRMAFLRASDRAATWSACGEKFREFSMRLLHRQFRYKAEHQAQNSFMSLGLQVRVCPYNLLKRSHIFA